LTCRRPQSNGLRRLRYRLEIVSSLDRQALCRELKQWPLCQLPLRVQQLQLIYSGATRAHLRLQRQLCPPHQRRLRHVMTMCLGL